MTWFDASGGHLRFRRTSRQPVREWLASDEGQAAIQSAARGIRFSLTGRARTARRRIARTLSSAINSPTTRAALDAECEHFLGTCAQLAYAPALPRLTLGGRRLVVVPRTMIVARLGGAAATRLGAALGSSVPDGFKAFFADWMLRAIDDAIRRAVPETRRPIEAQEPWSCVHVEPDFRWLDIASAGAWRGHFMMFELPTGGLRRRERHALIAAIAELSASLPGLSRTARNGTLRMAADQMGSMRF